MAHDTGLENRIDRLVTTLGPTTKKKMFGGVGYMVKGSMCFGIHKDSLVLRLSADNATELMTRQHVRPFDVTGRPMKGWLLISPEALNTDELLLAMLELGFDFASGLAGGKQQTRK